MSPNDESLSSSLESSSSPPPPPSPLDGISATTADLIDIVNNVCIHMEVKNRLNKQTSSDSSKELMDDEDSTQKDDEHYFNKDNLIKLLRSYRAYLSGASGPAKRQALSLSNQRSLDDDEDPMETEAASMNQHLVTNTNKEILHEIKFFVSETKLKRQGGDSDDLEDVFKEEEDNEFSSANEDNDDILPRNLIVTSIPSQVFTEFDVKLKFESIFLKIDEKCSFCYFRLFKRCCIQYENPISAVLARFELENLVFQNENLKIFLTKVKNWLSYLVYPMDHRSIS